MQHINHMSAKRILITQNSIRTIAGSEVLTLELAEYLQAQGASVTVFTYFLGSPMAEIFKEKKINVTAEPDTVSMSDFDYIWVNHQVLPSSFIRELGVEKPDKIPAFIFLHMSSLDSIVLEQPYIWDLERNLAALTLYVSQEAADKYHAKFFTGGAASSALYPNPAPVGYSELSFHGSNRPNRVLIVSNHPQQEILEAKLLLSKKGIKVDGIGDRLDDYALVTPNLIKQYDVVITIGKTVQYCLCAGIPVYVYDHFGGPGYLDDKNFNKAEYHNFSGRGFAKSKSAMIVRDILDGYSKALSYQEKNRTEFIEKFSVDRVVPKMLETLKARSLPVPFEQAYVNYLLAASELARSQIVYGNESQLVIAHLENGKRNQAEQMDQLSVELNSKKKELGQALTQLELIKSSRTYRLTSLITAAGSKVSGACRYVRSIFINR